MNWEWLNWNTARDAVQIAILYLAIYSILKAARGTRFGQVLTGVGILFGVSIAFTFLFHFDVLARILQLLLLYLALSTVVLFQPEIRRTLAAIGSLLFSESSRPFDGRGITPEKLTEAILHLSRKRIGALMAFERGISLRGYEESGVALDAIPSRELLISIFTPPLPMHDGGITIRNGRIASAHCLFPVSVNQNLYDSGMRHRAAVGMSEETDALVIVVSEESGRISIAHNGKLIRHAPDSEASQTAILRWVRKALPAKKTVGDRTVNWFRERLAKLGRSGTK